MRFPQNSSGNEILASRQQLILADEQMKRGNHEKALDYVRKVYETDPRNMYARAYEERILMMMAEAKARKESERILSNGTRDFIASQEKPGSHQQSTVDHRTKTDPIIREIEDSLIMGRSYMK